MRQMGWPAGGVTASVIGANARRRALRDSAPRLAGGMVVCKFA